jgi:hypothetical protein
VTESLDPRPCAVCTQPLGDLIPHATAKGEPCHPDCCAFCAEEQERDLTESFAVVIASTFACSDLTDQHIDDTPDRHAAALLAMPEMSQIRTALGWLDMAGGRGYLEHVGIESASVIEWVRA